MRGLVILAILLVATAAAALVVWPRFVDEAALRGSLERLALARTGQPLEIRGGLTLTLLPTPRLSVDKVILGGSQAGAADARLEIDRVQIDLEPLALLTGRVKPQRLLLLQPALALKDWDDVPWPALVPDQEGGWLAQVTGIEIVDGRIDAAAAPAGPWPRQLEAIDLEIRREIEPSEIEGAGTLAVGGEPLEASFRASPFARGQPSSLELTLQAGGEGASRLDFRGSAWPEQPRLQGTATLATSSGGRLPSWLEAVMFGRELPALPEPGELQARVVWTAESLMAEELTLRLGSDALSGAATLRLGPAPTLELSLTGARLAPQDQLLAAIATVADEVLAGSRLSGRLDLRLGALLWRGDEVRRLAAAVRLEQGGLLTLEELTATLPGESLLAWEGAPPEPNGTGLRGRLSLDASDLRRLLRWLGAAAEDLPPGGLSSLLLTAEVEAAAERWRLANLEARLDATQLRGVVEGRTGRRPALDLALAADRLDTDLYFPDWHGPASVPRWRARLAGLDLALDLSVDRLTHAGLRADKAILRGAVRSGQVTLESLRLGSLAGGGLELSATGDAISGAYSLRAGLDVPEPKLLLRSLGQEPPPALERLAPLRLSLEVDGADDATAVEGQLVGDGLSAYASGTLSGLLDPSVFDLDLSLALNELSEVLTALGWVGSAPPALGPLVVDAELSRSGSPVELAFTSQLGAGSISGGTVLEPGAVRPRLVGELRGQHLELTLLGALYDALAVPLRFPPGLPWAWPGNWPAGQLDWDWLETLDLDLRLVADDLVRSAGDRPDAGVRLALSDGRLALRELDLPLGDGRIQGLMTLESKGAAGLIGADLQLSGLSPGPVLERLGVAAALNGELELGARLVAGGHSIAEIVGSLAGEGEIKLRRAELPGITLGTAATEAEPSTDILLLEGPFVLQQGIVRTTPEGWDLRFAGGEAAVALELDLWAWILDLELRGRSFEAEDRPFSLRFLGPPGRLRQVSR